MQTLKIMERSQVSLAEMDVMNARHPYGLVVEYADNVMVALEA